MTTAVVVGAIGLAAGGCGGGQSSHVVSVAIATSGDGGDMGWNDQGITAASEVAHRLKLHLEVAQGLGDARVTAQLKRLADSGVSLVIAHGRRYGAAAAATAAATGVPQLVFGSPERLSPGRVGDIEVAGQEGGYVAGYIAARASFIPSVGIVIASDDPNWYRIAGGFIAGARKFDPHVKILYTRVGAAGDEDVATSKRAADQLIARRSQMVLGLGERSTYGVMRATMNAQLGVREPKFDSMFVDVIGDKAGAGHRSITGLTAVKWNFEPAYRQAVADIRAGRFGRHPYTLDLANGGISVIANGRTPSDNYAAAMVLARKVERGEIKVPVTSDNAEVLALLKRR